MKIYMLFLALSFCALPPAALAQGREFDEDTFAMQKTGVDELKEQAASRPDKAIREIKYVIGKDKKWFTADDEVYHFFSARYDRNGTLAKKVCWGAGTDGVPGTKDDGIQNYQRYEYRKGKPFRDTLFSDPGEDGKWFTKDDSLTFRATFESDANGYKSREFRENARGATIRCIHYECDGEGRVLKDVEYSSPGPDGKWCTPDDEVEKYHRREYEAVGLVRVTECHRDQTGAGADGVWFTGDDVVSSTREFVRDPGGRIIKALKCVTPGPDGTWFTGDEIMQYYTVREYEPQPEKK